MSKHEKRRQSSSSLSLLPSSSSSSPSPTSTPIISPKRIKADDFEGNEDYASPSPSKKQKKDNNNEDNNSNRTIINYVPMVKKNVHTNRSEKSERFSQNSPSSSFITKKHYSRHRKEDTNDSNTMHEKSQSVRKRLFEETTSSHNNNNRLVRKKVLIPKEEDNKNDNYDDEDVVNVNNHRLLDNNNDNNTEIDFLEEKENFYQQSGGLDIHWRTYLNKNQEEKLMFIKSMKKTQQLMSSYENRLKYKQLWIKLQKANKNLDFYKSVQQFHTSHKLFSKEMFDKAIAKQKKAELDFNRHKTIMIANNNNNNNNSFGVNDDNSNSNNNNNNNNEPIDLKLQNFQNFHKEIEEYILKYLKSINLKRPSSSLSSSSLPWQNEQSEIAYVLQKKITACVSLFYPFALDNKIIKIKESKKRTDFETYLDQDLTNRHLQEHYNIIMEKKYKAYSSPDNKTRLNIKNYLKKCKQSNIPILSMIAVDFQDIIKEIDDEDKMLVGGRFKPNKQEIHKEKLWDQIFCGGNTVEKNYYSKLSEIAKEEEIYIKHLKSLYDTVPRSNNFMTKIYSFTQYITTDLFVPNRSSYSLGNINRLKNTYKEFKDRRRAYLFDMYTLSNEKQSLYNWETNLIQKIDDLFNNGGSSSNVEIIKTYLKLTNKKVYNVLLKEKEFLDINSDNNRDYFYLVSYWIFLKRTRLFIGTFEQELDLLDKYKHIKLIQNSNLFIEELNCIFSYQKKHNLYSKNENFLNIHAELCYYLIHIISNFQNQDDINISKNSDKKTTTNTTTKKDLKNPVLISFLKIYDMWVEWVCLHSYITRAMIFIEIYSLSAGIGETIKDFDVTKLIPNDYIKEIKVWITYYKNMYINPSTTIWDFIELSNSILNKIIMIIEFIKKIVKKHLKEIIKYFIVNAILGKENLEKSIFPSSHSLEKLIFLNDDKQIFYENNEINDDVKNKNNDYILENRKNIQNFESLLNLYKSNFTNNKKDVIKSNFTVLTQLHTKIVNFLNHWSKFETQLINVYGEIIESSAFSLFEFVFPLIKHTIFTSAMCFLENVTMFKDGYRDVLPDPNNDQILASEAYEEIGRSVKAKKIPYVDKNNLADIYKLEICTLANHLMKGSEKFNSKLNGKKNPVYTYNINLLSYGKCRKIIKEHFIKYVNSENKMKEEEAFGQQSIDDFTKEIERTITNSALEKTYDEFITKGLKNSIKDISDSIKSLKEIQAKEGIIDNDDLNTYCKAKTVADLGVPFDDDKTTTFAQFPTISNIKKGIKECVVSLETPSSSLPKLLDNDKITKIIKRLNSKLLKLETWYINKDIVDVNVINTPNVDYNENFAITNLDFTKKTNLGIQLQIMKLEMLHESLQVLKEGLTLPSNDDNNMGIGNDINTESLLLFEDYINEPNNVHKLLKATRAFTLNQDPFLGGNAPATGVIFDADMNKYIIEKGKTIFKDSNNGNYFEDKQFENSKYFFGLAQTINDIVDEVSKNFEKNNLPERLNDDDDNDELIDLLNRQMKLGTEKIKDYMNIMDNNTSDFIKSVYDMIASKLLMTTTVPIVLSALWYLKSVKFLINVIFRGFLYIFICLMCSIRQITSSVYNLLSRNNLLTIAFLLLIIYFSNLLFPLVFNVSNLSSTFSLFGIQNAIFALSFTHIPINDIIKYFNKKKDKIEDDVSKKSNFINETDFKYYEELLTIISSKINEYKYIHTEKIPFNVLDEINRDLSHKFNQSNNNNNIDNNDSVKTLKNLKKKLDDDNGDYYPRLILKQLILQRKTLIGKRKNYIEEYLHMNNPSFTLHPSEFISTPFSIVGVFEHGIAKQLCDGLEKFHPNSMNLGNKYVNYAKKTVVRGAQWAIALYFIASYPKKFFVKMINKSLYGTIVYLMKFIKLCMRINNKWKKNTIEEKPHLVRKDNYKKMTIEYSKIQRTSEYIEEQQWNIDTCMRILTEKNQNNGTKIVPYEDFIKKFEENSFRESKLLSKTTFKKIFDGLSYTVFNNGEFDYTESIFFKFIIHNLSGYIYSAITGTGFTTLTSGILSILQNITAGASSQSMLFSSFPSFSSLLTSAFGFFNYVAIAFIISLSVAFIAILFAMFIIEYYNVDPSVLMRYFQCCFTRIIYLGGITMALLYYTTNGTITIPWLNKDIVIINDDLKSFLNQIFNVSTFGYSLIGGKNTDYTSVFGPKAKYLLIAGLPLFFYGLNKIFEFDSSTLLKKLFSLSSYVPSWQSKIILAYDVRNKNTLFKNVNRMIDLEYEKSKSNKKREWFNLRSLLQDMNLIPHNSSNKEARYELKKFVNEIDMNFEFSNKEIFFFFWDIILYNDFEKKPKEDRKNQSLHDRLREQFMNNDMKNLLNDYVLTNDEMYDNYYNLFSFLISNNSGNINVFRNLLKTEIQNQIKKTLHDRLNKKQSSSNVQYELTAQYENEQLDNYFQNFFKTKNQKQIEVLSSLSTYLFWFLLEIYLLKPNKDIILVYIDKDNKKNIYLLYESSNSNHNDDYDDNDSKLFVLFENKVWKIIEVSAKQDVSNYLLSTLASGDNNNSSSTHVRQIVNSSSSVGGGGYSTHVRQIAHGNGNNRDVPESLTYDSNNDINNDINNDSNNDSNISSNNSSSNNSSNSSSNSSSNNSSSSYSTHVRDVPESLTHDSNNDINNNSNDDSNDDNNNNINNDNNISSNNSSSNNSSSNNSNSNNSKKKGLEEYKLRIAALANHIRKDQNMN